MLATHLAHVFEEVWAGFFLMEVYGTGWFLILNWLLWCIPAVLFYWVLRGRRWATRWSSVYAGVMIANGIGHNVLTLITGRYFGGFAGGFSGIALIVIGTALILTLRREQADRESGETANPRRGVF